MSVTSIKGQLSLLALCLLACGGDDGPSPATPSTTPDTTQTDAATAPATPTGTATTDAGAPAPVVPPLYVVSTGVVQGEDFVGYLTTTRSVAAGAKFNLDNAAELGGAGWIFGNPRQRSSVYVASLSEPTIVRWEVLDDGKFAKHETVNFTNLGLQNAYLAAGAPLFSDEKSYFADDNQDQIVVWNPKAMTLIKAIPLGDADQGVLKPIPEGTLLVRGDKVIVTIGWRHPDDTSVLGDHLRLVTIDTKTDTIVESHDVPRVSHLAPSATSSDGTEYLSPYSLYAAYREIGAGHGVASVAARILPGQTTLDATYNLDLSALVGGRPAGDFTLLDDQTALIRTWHPEAVGKVEPADWKPVLWEQSGFFWWRWHVGDAQAVQIPNQKPGALGATVFKIDGKTYVVRYAGDYSSTTLDEITPAGELVPTLEGPGQVIGPGVMRVN